MALDAVELSILCENTVGKAGLRGEWGLSVWIDTGTHRVLFDAGESTACVHNAREMGIDLGTADAVVLSHGHYDHTGGLAEVLGRLPLVPVYLHPAAFQHRYAKAGDIALKPEEVRDIGMPTPVREALTSWPDLRPIENPTEIVPGVWATGAIPRVEPTEGQGGTGALEPELTTPDPIADDMAVWVKTSAGILLVLGCAHAGLINTVRLVQKTNDRLPISGVIGGTHLRATTPERMAATIACLRSLPLTMLAACHCTGPHEAFLLQTAFPTQFVSMSAGTRLVFPSRPAKN